MTHKLRYTIFSLLFLPFLAAFAQTAPKHEIRATWLTTLGGMDWPSAKATSASGIQKQKEELCRILDELQQAHFNTVLFQTRLRGDVVYPGLPFGIRTVCRIAYGHRRTESGVRPAPVRHRRMP